MAIHKAMVCRWFCPNCGQPNTGVKSRNELIKKTCNRCHVKNITRIIGEDHIVVEAKKTGAAR